MKYVLEYDDSLRDQNLIPTRWVLTWKALNSHQVTAKARLVLQGFKDNQQDSLRVDSPTVNRVSIRFLLAWCSSKQYIPCLVDIKTAFLQSRQYPLEDGRVVYAVPPDDVKEILGLDSKKDYVFKLNKSVYGLKDAPREFYMTVVDQLGKLMKISKLDRSMFYCQDSSGQTHGIIGIHVDDLILCGSPRFMDWIMNTVNRVFKCGKIERGKFTYCGLKLDSDSSRICLTQKEYAVSLSPIKLSHGFKKVLNRVENTKFRSAVGNLAWLAGQTRPDISFVVNQMSAVQNNPSVSDVRCLNKLIRRVRFTSDFTLSFTNLNWSKSFLLAYADASLANVSDCYSQAGYLIFLAQPRQDRSGLDVTLIDWSSKKLRRVVRSTLSAETCAVNNATDQAQYVASLMLEITSQKFPIHVLNDNKSLNLLIHSDSTPTEKRLLIELSVLREQFRNGISYHFVVTKNCLADALTKYQATQSSALLNEVIQNSFIPAAILPETFLSVCF